MEELLKEVQEIYEGADKVVGIDKIIIPRYALRNLTISFNFGDTYYLYADRRCVCCSKDKSKVLTVLKAIKETEE